MSLRMANHLSRGGREAGTLFRLATTPYDACNQFAKRPQVVFHDVPLDVRVDVEVWWTRIFRNPAAFARRRLGVSLGSRRLRSACLGDICK